MFRILPILTPPEVAQLRQIAASVPFTDGRISNPHNKAKKNEQLLDLPAHNRSKAIIEGALARSEEFREFVFPVAMMQPMMTRYKPGMHYGAHSDAAFIPIAQGVFIRTDVSATIFLSDPASYEGGALKVHFGDGSMSFKLKAGEAIFYPSNTFHEVEPVTSGERLVVITFIQSRIADPFRRNLLFELNEIAALEGLKMDPANYGRLQVVREQLLRHFSDAP